MKILVINAGSSSLKYQLIDMNNDSVLAKGLCDRIGIEGGNFKQKVPGKEDYVLQVHMNNHEDAVKIVVDALTDKEHGVISSMAEIGAVGHRLVHGADKFSKSVIINEEVIDIVRECSVLSPLHNPANLTGVKACQEIMGDIPQVGVFDTGFHQTMPDYAYLYPIPYKYYEKYKIRRYGFHGTSHRYVSLRAAEMLGKKPEDIKIVTCHLGNGSSIAAIDGGKCLDTTMGMTPLEGIMMGTRSGTIDPAIIPFLMEKENMTAKDIDKMLNKESGILGISEKTSDNRDIEQGAKAGDARCQLVENMLCHQLTKYVGGYIAAMGGCDAVVFTGGIGENNPAYRKRVAEKLGFMGVKIDDEKNAFAKLNGLEVDISAADTTAHILVIPTNEELMIAKDTYELVK
ncbi:MAG: acetate kinase [Ruminococcaceae bacterium]|nr:acetate kinase [Oscillospiraceae bacterium]